MDDLFFVIVVMSLLLWFGLEKKEHIVISCSQQESLPFVNPVIGDIKKFYWSPIKVNDIRWNFEKFLITADGIPFKRYSYRP